MFPVLPPVVFPVAMPATRRSPRSHVSPRTNDRRYIVNINIILRMTLPGMTEPQGGAAEQGASESIGFLLLFSVVVAGVGLVTLYGYPLLLNQQASTDERIMERNLIVLQNDLNSLTYKTVPYQETSFMAGGGTLTVYNASYLPRTATFSIFDYTGTTYVTDFSPGDLRYQSAAAQTDLSLQNGAVMKYQPSGAVMLAQPRWYHDTKTNTWVFNLIGINSTGTFSRTGICTARMRLKKPPEYIYVYYLSVSGPIHIVYHPDPSEDFSTAWDAYFQQQLKMTPPIKTPTGSYEYTLPGTFGKPLTLVIKKYDVEIESL
jgi:hypothetical protein